MNSSKKSSQRQRDLEITRLKRDELEKQHKAELHIAKERLENEAQTQLQKLEIQQFQQEHCKQVAASALEETELVTKPSSNRSSTGKPNVLFTE